MSDGAGTRAVNGADTRVQAVHGRPIVTYRNVTADSSRWHGFRFRPGDIVISTPPKCGTTWTQMLCALLIFQTPDLPAPMAELSPWLDMLTRDHAEVTASLQAQGHRRFVKTHTPLDGLPWDERVTYLCVARDPRDVALSWDGHMANMDLDAFLAAREAAVGLDDLAELIPEGPPFFPDTDTDRFWLWVEDPTPPATQLASLQATLHHVATFWEAHTLPNVVLLRYEDLRADLPGQMRALAGRLGIEVPEQRWPELVTAAGFDEMRARAAHLVPDAGRSIFKNSREFFRSGSSGQWRRLLDDEGLARYKARVAALVPPELARWVHAGDDV